MSGYSVAGFASCLAYIFCGFRRTTSDAETHQMDRRINQTDRSNSVVTQFDFAGVTQLSDPPIEKKMIKPAVKGPEYGGFDYSSKGDRQRLALKVAANLMPKFVEEQQGALSEFENITGALLDLVEYTNLSGAEQKQQIEKDFKGYKAAVYKNKGPEQYHKLNRVLEKLSELAELKELIEKLPEENDRELKIEKMDDVTRFLRHPRVQQEIAG